LNSLVEVLKEASTSPRWRSAENLSRQSGLSPGTVRNIIKSGHANKESLIKLAPSLGKTVHEMFILAEVLPSDGEDDEVPEGAPRLRELYRQASPLLRAVTLGGLQAGLEEERRRGL